MPSPSVGAVAVMALLAFGVLVGSGVSPVQESSSATAPIIVAASAVDDGVPSAAGRHLRLAIDLGGSDACAGGARIRAHRRRPNQARRRARRRRARPRARRRRAVHRPRRAAADHARLPDRALRSGLQRRVRPELAGDVPVEDTDRLRASCSATTTRWPAGSSPTRSRWSAVRGRPRRRRSTARCTPTSRRARSARRARLSGAAACTRARPQTLGDQLVGRRQDMEGLRRGHRQRRTRASRRPAATRRSAGADADQTPSLRGSLRDLARPVRLLPLGDRQRDLREHVVGLEQLAPDLAAAPKTPSLAYIVPDRCHDGSEEPCAPGQPSGLAAGRRLPRQGRARDRGAHPPTRREG